MPREHGLSSADEHFPALDGLRGLAALAVLCSHLHVADMGLVYGIPLGGLGRSGVWLFFVLSAFLLTRQGLTAASDGRLTRWVTPYILRRFFRIYPVLILAVIIDLATGRIVSSTAIGILTLTEAPGIYFTVPPEFKYYFVIPFVAALAAWPVAALIVLAVLSVLSSIFGGGYDLISLFGAFAIGSAAAIVYEWKPALARKTAIFWPIGFVVCFFSLNPIVALIAPSLLKYTLYDLHVLHAAAWSATVLACAYGLRAMHIFATWPMRWAGQLSFGIYLLHPPILAGAKSIGIHGAFWCGALVFCVVIAVAYLAYRLVEAPARKLGYRIESYLSLCPLDVLRAKARQTS